MNFGYVPSPADCRDEAITLRTVALHHNRSIHFFYLRGWLAVAPVGKAGHAQDAHRVFAESVGDVAQHFVAQVLLAVVGVDQARKIGLKCLFWLKSWSKVPPALVQSA